jgi:glycosyltransferase involved in cell wall biosynthesis
MTVRENNRRSRPTMASDTLIIVTAQDEADRIEATLGGLARAFPDALVWVADDGSIDETSAIARRSGAGVVRSERTIGKGGAATLAVRDALAWLEGDAVVVADESDPKVVADGHPSTALVPSADVLAGVVVVLCDGDLGDSAVLLVALADAVREGRADLAVAVFSRHVGGGLGLVVGFARRAIHRRCGLKLEAPISGQRALRVSALKDVLPFADGFGMEVGMTIDAARAGHRVVEVELDLHHRATGRTLSGFLHRGRQLLDCLRAYLARR